MIDQNNKYLETKQKFDIYYDKQISPTIQKIEKERRKYLSWFLFTCISVLIWIYYTFQEFSTQNNNYGLILCLLVLLICLPMFFYYRKTKESILPLIINFFGEFQYTYNPSLSEKVFNQSKIMKKYDRIECDDGFNGQYDGVPVSIIEYTGKKQQIQQKENKAEVIYKKQAHGIIFRAEMNKKFEGQTLVLKDKGILNSITRYKGLERVGIESPTFEKLYEVYSDNQIEARYILTPVMLDCMENLIKIFPKIEYSFLDNEIMINIMLKKNFFECSTFFRSVSNAKRIEKIFKQFYYLFEIVETLQLNQKKLL